MKPTRFVLDNFGSHAHTEWALDGERLVVVVGENGAGKSTLVVDSLAHALFKDAPGGVDDIVRLGATDSSVAVEFVLDGARWRAIRRRTTRSGGKTSADLQRQEPDGSWIPVASGDREVPAAVRDLLGMDVATFRTAVLLAQREAGRFLAATPGKGTASDPGRAAILSAIVVDARFARAEAAARERARDLEARVAADRATVERLAAAIAELDPVRAVLAERRAALAELEAELATAAATRAEATERIRALDAELAAADAVRAEAGRLEQERTALAGEWRAASERRSRHEQAIAEAQALLASAAEVDAATAELPAVRAEAERLAYLEVTERDLARQLAAAQRELAEAERPHAHALATWRAQHDAAAARVAELVERGRAGTSVCVTCGQPIGQAQALEQLSAARAAEKALGPEPAEPLAIARARAALARLEPRIAALDWDPAALVAIRERLVALERTAARTEGMAAARATIERETAAIEEAGRDLARITERGSLVKARLDELGAQLAAASTLEGRRRNAADALATVAAANERLERTRREVERSITLAEASIAQAERLAAERDELAASLEDAQTEIGRLRRLVGAFGVAGIPARIVEGVLPELEAAANEMLAGDDERGIAGLRPGWRLEVRATRTTRDGSRVVDEIGIAAISPVGEIPAERLSGGERTSVALALASALSRLAARRAGTALRFQVVDEPDGLDVAARRQLGHALRGLLHRGELDLVVLVTHTPDLVEFADRVDEVTKNGRGSVVTQIA